MWVQIPPSPLFVLKDWMRVYRYTWYLANPTLATFSTLATRYIWGLSLDETAIYGGGLMAY